MNPCNQYLRQVGRVLPCPIRQRRAIVSEISKSVSEFLTEHPGADLQAITNRFGTPESVAASYLYNAETSEVLHRYRIRRRIVAIIAAIAAAIILVWLIGVAVLTYHDMTNFPGYIEVATTQETQYETPTWYHDEFQR